MLHIALCEDEKVFAEAEASLCRGILSRMKLESSVAVFDSAEAFLAAFSGGRRFDLILLDIMMDGINGMELARTIRESDSEAEIVFITSSREFALDGYDVGALHYLMKPVDETQLEPLIKKVYEATSRPRWFTIRSGAQTYQIALNDMITLETAGKKVAITTTDGVLHYNGKLAALLDELPDGCFVRCHQAFAVNLDHIREFDRFEVITKTGVKIPISRSYLAAVKIAYLLRIVSRNWELENSRDKQRLDLDRLTASRSTNFYFLISSDYKVNYVQKRVNYDFRLLFAPVCFKMKVKKHRAIARCFDDIGRVRDDQERMAKDKKHGTRSRHLRDDHHPLCRPHCGIAAVLLRGVSKPIHGGRGF